MYTVDEMKSKVTFRLNNSKTVCMKDNAIARYEHCVENGKLVRKIYGLDENRNVTKFERSVICNSNSFTDAMVVKIILILGIVKDLVEHDDHIGKMISTPEYTALKILDSDEKMLASVTKYNRIDDSGMFRIVFDIDTASILKDDDTNVTILEEYLDSYISIDSLSEFPLGNDLIEMLN